MGGVVPQKLTDSNIWYLFQRATDYSDSCFLAISSTELVRRAKRDCGSNMWYMPWCFGNETPIDPCVSCFLLQPYPEVLDWGRILCNARNWIWVQSKHLTCCPITLTLTELNTQKEKKPRIKDTSFHPKEDTKVTLPRPKVGKQRPPGCRSLDDDAYHSHSDSWIGWSPIIWKREEGKQQDRASVPRNILFQVLLHETCLTELVCSSPS